MRVEFDGGTLLLREASEDVPHAEWDDRVEEYRAPTYRYRALLEWADAWNEEDSPSAGQELAQQETIQSAAVAVEDTARAYPALALDPALQIEPREYQQAALDAWRTNDRRGSVVLPTVSGKDVPRYPGDRGCWCRHARGRAADRPDEPVARHAHQRLRRSTAPQGREWARIGGRRARWREA